MKDIPKQRWHYKDGGSSVSFQLGSQESNEWRKLCRMLIKKRPKDSMPTKEEYSDFLIGLAKGNTSID
jgi:hypothetical protein